MSGNLRSKTVPESSKPSTPRKRLDVRVRQTRELLGDALVALLQERSFEDITVQDVLSRAGVGRTTFYTHYSDKQDLFLSDVEDFLEGMTALLNRCGAPASRLAPVEEILTHLADMRSFYKALTDSGKLTEIRELGIPSFARSIAQRLKATCHDLSPSHLQATSHALAGALFSLLDWWMNHGEGCAPKEMEHLFHHLAWNGCNKRLGKHPSQFG